MKINKEKTMVKKATGSRGSWFAVTPWGEKLPCVLKQYWGVGVTYHDPYFYDPRLKRNREYIDAIKRGRVLVTINENDGRRYDGAEKVRRTGYIGGCKVFKVTDVSSSESGLTFSFAGAEQAAAVAR
jgi:hypothetical protein